MSDSVFNALSDGTIYFALYGSSLNHNLIGWNNSNSQSESFVLVVLKAAMERKKKGTIWKSNENWVRNWCQKWHTILFTATNRENKQCTVLKGFSTEVAEIASGLKNLDEKKTIDILHTHLTESPFFKSII